MSKITERSSSLDGALELYREDNARTVGAKPCNYLLIAPACNCILCTATYFTLNTGISTKGAIIIFYIVCSPRTVVPTKSDSDVVFCLQSLKA